jgi:hypothetical protein
MNNKISEVIQTKQARVMPAAVYAYHQTRHNQRPYNYEIGFMKVNNYLDVIKLSENQNMITDDIDDDQIPELVPVVSHI